MLSYFLQVIGKLASLQELKRISAKDKLRLKMLKGDIVVERLDSKGVYQPLNT